MVFVGFLASRKVCFFHCLSANPLKEANFNITKGDKKPSYWRGDVKMLVGRPCEPQETWAVGCFGHVKTMFLLVLG